MSTGRKHAILLCLAMMLPLWFTAVARGGEKPKPSIDRDQPIQIVSDRLDAYHEKKMVVFTGNVVATQGKRTIKSDRLTLYYREDKKTSTRSTKTEMEGVGNVERVEAKGNVTITEEERVVTGDEAIFEQDAEKVTVTGNAVMREGANIVRGDRIVVFMQENRGVVESVENRRVKATIYPGQVREKKP